MVCRRRKLGGTWLVVLLTLDLSVCWIVPPLLRQGWTRPTTTRAFSSRREQEQDKAARQALLQNHTQDVPQQIALGRQQLAGYFNFDLDDWQLQAGGAICQGFNVIVCAPTGAGKTVVGEMALLHAYYSQQQSGIYTTPLKALSNQKYTELCRIFGTSDTGLSTGDVSINKGARITVMTTEVYRNIAWRSSSSLSTDNLINNTVVVLDEFHYMGHAGRGGVWEECIITSPAHTQIVGLSATLANGPSLAAWIESVTERPTILIEATERPVPLRYLFCTKDGLFPLFRNPNAGPGAPKGLLGYRGDGMVQQKQRTVDSYATTGGFGRAQRAQKEEQLPRGLQVNPALKAVTAKHLRRVEKTLERQKTKRILQNQDDDYDNDWRGQRYYKPKPLSAREERKERERLLRNEMRRAVPSIFAVTNRLKQKDLLPAIFFIFSRVGCDQAARNLYQYMKGPKDPTRMLQNELDELQEDEPPTRPKRRTRQRGRRRDEMLQDAEGRTFRPKSNYVSEELLSSIFEDEGSLLDEDDFDDTSPLSAQNWEYYAKAGLLNYKQVREVASRISVFNDENPEIAFDDDIVEQYLFGVGSHHAGMLPAHKSFVELLYRNQLMFVVFATETLAAGINMPARTTVIGALAKRTGDGNSMKLLGTSDLLQMAGRAGRRGMDTDGTCVIVATPFESHDDAAKILTDPIEPISSQFSPSYSLAINLIARGEGKLDVARQLVRKSFAMWEKQDAEEDIAAAVENHGQGVDDVLEASAQERFMNELVHALRFQVVKRRAKFDIDRIKSLLDILQDREALKKTSKSFIGAEKMLELEETTLRYLERELVSMKALPLEEDDEELLGDMLNEDEKELVSQIKKQTLRTLKTEKEARKHPFSVLATVANEMMAESTPQATVLLSALRSARRGTVDDDSLLTARELSDYAKSAITFQRKARKLKKKSPDLDTRSLMEQVNKVDSGGDDSWGDFLSITRTLAAYGCLTPENPIDENFDIENEIFTVTQSGVNVGMLGFDNTLWCLVAMGGTWDVAGASSKLDEFRIAMDMFDEDGEMDWYDESVSTKRQSGSSLTESPSLVETCELVALLRSLEPNELAGYVASLVADYSRSSGPSVVELFQRLTPLQQRVIQKSLLVMERLVEVQKLYAVDETTRNCILDISNCEVVTAWAGGCTWNEALQISGSSPGDLARTLSRVLDAVRQLGNLPFTPIRKSDVLEGNITPRGIHPDIRRLCREAARAINRYPVKDPLTFESGDDDGLDVDENNDEQSEGEFQDLTAS